MADKTVSSLKSQFVIHKLITNIIGPGNSGKALGFACFLFLVTAWLPEGVKSIFVFIGIQQGCQPDNVAMAVGLLQLFCSVGILGFAYHVIQQYSNGRISVQTKIAQPGRVLILILSNLGISNSMKITDWLSDPKVFETANYDEFISFLSANRMNWQMSFNAIKHHIIILERIFVITSDQSHKEYELFKKAVCNFFPQVTVDERGPKDFEDANKIYETVEELFIELAKKYKDRDIVMDITGGQKVTSIAAANATLVSGRQFQYISTNDITKVFSYDMEIVEPE